MLYNSVPWPQWRADIAPDYTLFMPLTSRSSTVYQHNVPARPNSGETAVGTAPTPQNPESGSLNQGGYIELRSLASSLVSGLRLSGSNNQQQTSSARSPSSINAVEEGTPSQSVPVRTAADISSTMPFGGIFSRFFAPTNYHSISQDSRGSITASARNLATTAAEEGGSSAASSSTFTLNPVVEGTSSIEMNSTSDANQLRRNMNRSNELV